MSLGNYKHSDALTALGNEVINASFPHLKTARIFYMTCDKPKKNGTKIVLADCEKLTDKVSALTGYDFLITFYRDSKDLTPQAQRILMEHELRHIGWDGENTKKIIPHDVQDFAAIISKYGLQWHQTQQVSMFEETERR